MTPAADPSHEHALASNAMTSRSMLPSAHETVNFQITCVECGYSLIGLDLDARCPECGTPVKRSVQGDLLIYASLGELVRLAHGAKLVSRGVVLLVAGLPVVLAVGMMAYALMLGLRTVWAGPAIRGAAWMALAVIALAMTEITRGWWKLAGPVGLATAMDSTANVRRGVLCASSALVGVSLVPLLLSSSWVVQTLGLDGWKALAQVSDELTAIGPVLFLGVLGAFWFQAAHLVRKLLERVPVRTGVRRLRRHAWTMPLALGALILAVFAGANYPLIPCAFGVLGGAFALHGVAVGMESVITLGQRLPGLVASKREMEAIAQPSAARTGSSAQDPKIHA